MQKPVNAVKGKQGFQRTSPASPPPSPRHASKDVSSAPTEEEIALRAREVQALYAAFRRDEPPAPMRYHSLMDVLDTSTRVSGIVAVTVPAHEMSAPDDLLAQVEAELPARHRERFRRTLSQVTSSTTSEMVNLSDAEAGDAPSEWRRLYGAVLPGQVLTSVIHEDGSHTHTVGFIDARWTPTVESFLRMAGQRGCILTGEVCEPEAAYEVKGDAFDGAIYRMIDESEEEAYDD